MATRVVEWKKLYTWWKAISIDENKVISLNLRDENNLIIYDSGDDEIYVDLQLPDEIRPTYAFPVWVTTGRVIIDNGWDVTGTIICAKTTSWDNIKLLYGDNWKLYIDNGTGIFKQIYLKNDIDEIIQTLQNFIDYDVNTKVFDLSQVGATQSAIDEAQPILDYYLDGKIPIIYAPNLSFVYTWTKPSIYAIEHDEILSSDIHWLTFSATVFSRSTSKINLFAIQIIYENGEVISTSASVNYLDLQIAYVGSSEPNTVKGKLWYDTANSVMKVYDGLAWQTI